MQLNAAIVQLAQQATLIESLVQGVSAETARQRPAPDAWSMLEVVNHLLDEEREDFRVRLDIILHRPDTPWPPIDPQGWVITRKYNRRNWHTSLAAFSAERAQSLDWLQSLNDPDWHTVAPTPWGGEIRAGDMLAAWLAHDLLHIRQLVELRWSHTLEAVEPYLTRYAGEW